MLMPTSSYSLCILIIALLYFIFHLRISICDDSLCIPSDNIALNCGSSLPITTSYDGRNWTGDIGSEFMSSTPDNKSRTSKASSTDPAIPEVPYMTARIFYSQFTYTFNVNPGPKFVRLHFYPLGLNASQSFLTVTASAGRYTLLRNFSASLVADYFQVPFLVREFTVHVSGNILDITFAPSSNASLAYAFVNGIEVVSMPLNLYVRGGDVPIPLVGHYPALFYINNTYALETCYRVNVGGANIPPQHDTGMFRNWTRDDGYIYGGALGIVPFDYIITVRFPPAVPPYTAPEMVYRTARSMGPDYHVNLNYNLSWFFPVDSGFNYLVRLHFCEVNREVTKINQRVFVIFINNETADHEFDVIAFTGGYAVPRYKDYVVMVPEVNKGEKQDLWLELHPYTRSKPLYLDAILNGAEIFKLSDGNGNLAGLNPSKIESVKNLYPSAHPSSKSSKIIFIVVGCLLSGLVFFLICLIAFYSKINRERILSWLVLQLHYLQPGRKEKTYVSHSLPCHHFSLDEIKTATCNFDEALVIGLGGFGKVYKGKIKNGATTIAIKRREQTAEQGFQEFQTEVVILSQLRHHNLVSLIGYCTADHEMILVYDYMANGTLYDHLHSQKSHLTWEQRLKICIGAARGLHYLHTGTKHRIIHRDVKTTNILLDENWVAKISDFGLSKLGAATSTHATTNVKGSFGYMDPEYYRRHKLTEKSDVYSFGVVLLEVMCAKPAVNPTAEDEHASLADWALCHYKNGTMDELLDSYLQGMIKPESFLKFVNIAMDCLAERGVDRPPMAEVLRNLELALQLQNSAEVGKVQHGPPNGDVAMHIGVSSNSDMSPGVEFSEIMMPAGR